MILSPTLTNSLNHTWQSSLQIYYPGCCPHKMPSTTAHHIPTPWIFYSLTPWKLSWYIPSGKIGQNFWPLRYDFFGLTIINGLEGMHFGHFWPPKTPFKNFQLFVGPHLGSFTQMSEFTHMSDFNQISKNALLCSAILAQKRQVIVKALNGLA